MGVAGTAALWFDSRSRASVWRVQPAIRMHPAGVARDAIRERSAQITPHRLTPTGPAPMLSPRSSFPLAPITLAVSLALSGCAISVEAPQPAPAPTQAAAPAAAAPAAPRPAAAPGAPGAAPAAGAPGAAAPGATPPAGAGAPAPGALRPFAEVSRDAKRKDGFLPLWTKDERVLIEISPEQLNKPMFFTVNVMNGIGEPQLMGGLMGGSWGVGRSQVVELRRVGNTLQVIAQNLAGVAKPGTPNALSVEQNFSDSLIGSIPVLSAPHPERKTFLVEANTLLFTDIPYTGGVLERNYRQNYAIDARNSSIEKTWAEADRVAFSVKAHYGTARIATPQPPMPGAAPLPPGAPVPSVPVTLPDPRSLFFTYYYSFSSLPAQPMRARAADPRVGFFTTPVWDFDNEKSTTARMHQVNRWRLEKKDPNAALSEPVKPITFWLDRNIPEQYREPIRQGVLEWNKAFEKAGFKNAVRVELQPADADWDTADVRRASIRWQTVPRSSYGAIGPSQVDPRSGEILDADIAFDANTVRNLRLFATEAAGTLAGAGNANMIPGTAAGEQAYCDIGAASAHELGFALDVLESRGDIDLDNKDAEQFVFGWLKETAMHEVGHTLGMRHNFRASTIHPLAKLRDPAFVKANGITGSVMEYPAFNLNRAGKPQGPYFMETVGPYDIWAIQYAYTPFTPEQEAAELAKIAGRSAEPLLAYSSDEDNFEGMDPLVNQFDLGDDPLAFAKERFAIVDDLWSRAQSRQLKPGQSFATLRRQVQRGMTEMRRASSITARYVGGANVVRDFAGTNRNPITPVPAAKQREALQLLSTSVLSANAFKFKPDFVQKLTATRLEQSDAAAAGGQPLTTEYRLANEVLTTQRAVLAQLLNDRTATNLLENALRDTGNPMRLSEVYETVRGAVWSELASGADIGLFRRNLQREHVRALSEQLVRPAPTMPADAKALMREQARSLLAQLKAAAAKGNRSPEARAHLAESANTLQEALSAPLMRTGA